MSPESMENEGNIYCPQCGKTSLEHPRWSCDFILINGRWHQRAKSLIDDPDSLDY